MLLFGRKKIRPLALSAKHDIPFGQPPYASRGLWDRRIGVIEKLGTSAAFD